jgi:hypothetical protein
MFFTIGPPVTKAIVSSQGPLSKRLIAPSLDRLRVGVSVKVHSFASAHLWDGKPEHQTGAGYGH